ncbi:MAG: TOBE domain-containing protein [Actinomycetota bacterium]|nr:TOBE domain-containing protein [Actinomycetota bacterium]
MADTIALMLDARIEAHGSPADFYTAPATLQAARFFGATNEIPGALAGTVFTCALGRLEVAPGGRDGPGLLLVRPEALRLGIGRSDFDERPNTLRGKVIDVQFRGAHQTVRVRLSGRVSVTVTVASALHLDADDEIVVQLPPAACRVFEMAPDRVRDDGSSPSAQPTSNRERSRA